VPGIWPGGFLPPRFIPGLWNSVVIFWDTWFDKCLIEC
jgi:hypothetical protein